MNPIKANVEVKKKQNVRKRRRKRTPDPIYHGFPRPIPSSQLPTYKDVGLGIENYKQFEGKREDLAIDFVVEDIRRIYDKASIPTITPKKIRQKVKRLASMKKIRLAEEKIDKRRNTMRVQGKRRRKFKNGKTKGKVDDVLTHLFSVADVDRVPLKEREFFEDQTTSRKMTIGSLDVKQTTKNKEKIKRVEGQLAAKNNEEARKAQETTVMYKGTESDQYNSMDTDEDKDWEKTGRNRTKPIVKKRRTKEYLEEMESVFEISERFGLTDMATAHMVNQCSTVNVLTRNTTRRMRKSMRLKKVQKSKGKRIIALGFDERKDDTKVEAGEGLKGNKRYEIKKVENCSIVFWPGEEFAGHVVPHESTGQALAQSVHSFLNARNTDVTSLRAVLTDGCAKMTGFVSGAQAELERLLKRPLQRVVCFFHHLEKPFEKLFVTLDGGTNSPETFSGPIGKAICSDVWKRKVVKFQRMPNAALLADIQSITADGFKDLNRDQQYLIRMCEAVLTGQVSRQWAETKPGPVVHSRWTTTQARILRLYLSESKPSSSLTRLVRYITKVYTPTLIAAKRQNKVKDGPPMLLLEIQSVRQHCTKKERTVLEPAIQRNGFFAHHEAVLVSLLSSDTPEDRQYAVRVIRDIRRRGPMDWACSRTGLRPYKVGRT